MTLVSCKQRREAIRQLGCAQAIMETAPDSALVFLDSIRSHPGVLDKRHRMEYETAMVQAKYKCYKDISEDTAVFEARRYFVKTKDYGQQALAALYSGCVYEERGEYEMSMEAYKEAMKPATAMGDSLIMARIQQCIGSLLYSQGLYEEALESYKKAAEICRSIPEKQAQYYGNIGRCFILMKENDSAFYYYRKGIDYAIRSDNSETQSILLQNLSVLYRECQMYDEALSTLRQSLQLNPDVKKYPYYNLNFADIYNLLNQNDSLTYYINLLKNDLECIEDKPLLTGIYSILSEYEMQRNNYDSALYYQTKRSEMIEDIYQERMEQRIYEIQQKYDFEAEQNRNNVLLLNRKNKIVVLTVFLLIASILIIFFCFRLINNRKNEAFLMKKMIYLEHENTELNEQKNDLKKEIAVLNQEKTKLEKQNNSQFNEDRINYIQLQIEQLHSELELTTEQLKENTQWRTSLMCKIAMVDKNIKNNGRNIHFEQIKKYVYGGNISTWEAIVKSIEKSYPNLSDNIRLKFPEFNENEFRVCILSFMPFSVQDVADILDISTNTVGKIRSNIRKKIKMKKTRGSISDEIMKILEQDSEI